MQFETFRFYAYLYSLLVSLEVRKVKCYNIEYEIRNYDNSNNYFFNLKKSVKRNVFLEINRRYSYENWYWKINNLHESSTKLSQISMTFIYIIYADIT